MENTLSEVLGDLIQLLIQVSQIHCVTLDKWLNLSGPLLLPT